MGKCLVLKVIGPNKKWDDLIFGIPSGKHTKSYGKIIMFNGKIHYFYGHFL